MWTAGVRNEKGLLSRMSIKIRSDAELHGHYTPDDGPSQGGGGRAPQEGGAPPQTAGGPDATPLADPPPTGPRTGQRWSLSHRISFFCIIPPCRACHRLFSQAGLTMSPAWGVSKTNSTAKSIENSGRNTSACAKTKENISKMTSVAKTI